LAGQVGRAGALLGEQRGQGLVEVGVGIGGHGPKLAGALDVGLGAVQQHVGDRAPEVAVQLRHRLGRDVLDAAGPVVEAADLPDVLDRALQAADLRQIVADRPALGLEGGEHRLEAGEVQGHREPGIGHGEGVVMVGDIGRHLPQGALGDGGRGAVVHHLEARRDPGLQREAPQQLLAEGVDGLDLQPARRLQRLGEQAPGLGQLAMAETGRVAALQRAQLLAQLDVGGDAPLAQSLEQPPLHLGGGGLGVGHAQDRLGRRAGQQQARDPVDQGLGLARAGIGRDEGRDGRVGGDALGVDGQIRHLKASPCGGGVGEADGGGSDPAPDGFPHRPFGPPPPRGEGLVRQGEAHSEPSPSSPLVDHSNTRARCP
jgi:hypothetical protein